MARTRYTCTCISLGVILLAAAILLPLSTARACSIDGIASLSVNGNTATLNGDSPNASTLAYWAPFNLLAAAPGDSLRLAENMNNVQKSIPKESTALPFKWSFGDGATALGQTVSHRYAHTGWYKIAVRYYWPSHRQWVEFDSAQQHIVPSGELFWANLGFYAGKVFLWVIRLAIWGVLGLVLVLLVLEKVSPGARKRLWRRRAARVGN